jgi:hypothetical protein
VRSVPKDSKEEDTASMTVQLSSTTEARSEAKDESNQKSKSTIADAKNESKTMELDAAAKKRAKSGRPSMPMWALTEDKAAEVTTAVEEDELDDLLDFAKNLGKPKYRETERHKEVGVW